MEKRPSIVFMGTPVFALRSLERLAVAGYDIRAVVTQPDKPQGRGNRIVPSPVKEFAAGRGIPVLQPRRLGEVLDPLRELAADFIVVVAFGQILSRDVLCMPCRVCKTVEHRACINVHASLLPKYRGAGPIPWALINGDSETGVTTMLMEESLDSGPILLQEKVAIADDDTAATLYDKLAATGGELLIRTLDSFDTITPQPQDHAQATYIEKLTRQTGVISWDRPAGVIHNLVRGCNPWPAASTSHNGRRLIIWKTEPRPGDPADAAPGTILDTRDGIHVATGRGVLVICELQREGKARLAAGAFLRGFPLKPGDKLGS
jgi:methionyl-tRNA formyltransferase